MPLTRLPLPTSKKAQKCKYLTTGLSRITGPKNKKLKNSISFHFYIHVMTIKSTTYAKFGKKSKNYQNCTPAPQG